MRIYEALRDALEFFLGAGLPPAFLAGVPRFLTAGLPGFFLEGRREGASPGWAGACLEDLSAAGAEGSRLGLSAGF